MIFLRPREGEAGRQCVIVRYDKCYSRRTEKKGPRYHKKAWKRLFALGPESSWFVRLPAGRAINCLHDVP